MITKPGYRTSEFWFTLVSFLFSGLYLIGILKENDQKEELIEIVSHAVESCILIGGQLIILYKYIKGREKIKIASSTISSNKNARPKQHRPNKTRSTKTNTKIKRKS